MYEVITPRRVQRVIAALPTTDSRRVLMAIKALADSPRPPSATKLRGEDLWRIRVGDYRVVYAVEDQRLVVTIVRVGHRREVYR